MSLFGGMNVATETLSSVPGAYEEAYLDSTFLSELKIASDFCHNWACQSDNIAVSLYFVVARIYT